MRKVALLLLLPAALLLGTILAEGAGGQDRLPAAVEPAVPTADTPGLWQRITAYVRSQQRELHRGLAGAIRSLREERSAAAAWSLIFLSFLYGVFHAAGPGHGKAVISTYLLTHESQLRRGLWLAGAAALMQGVTAILLVEVLVALIGWTRRDTQGAVSMLETVSFALIALLGAALAARAVWTLWRRLGPGRRNPQEQAAGEAQPGGGDMACSTCDHVHGPSAEQLRAPFSLRTAAGIVVSIGIRPCSGAVLVLLFAQVLGLRVAGMGAVLAMSLGTAITVALLAILAVGSRQLAMALLRFEGDRLTLAGSGLALLGGTLILALGVSLFLGSLGGQHPLM